MPTVPLIDLFAYHWPSLRVTIQYWSSPTSTHTLTSMCGSGPVAWGLSTLSEASWPSHFACGSGALVVGRAVGGVVCGGVVCGGVVCGGAVCGGVVCGGAVCGGV